jgi:hypothetical protein
MQIVAHWPFMLNVVMLGVVKLNDMAPIVLLAVKGRHKALNINRPLGPNEAETLLWVLMAVDFLQFGLWVYSQSSLFIIKHTTILINMCPLNYFKL